MNIPKTKILIVDDERLMRSVLKMILEKNGYTIVEAENGQEALEKVIADSTIDLIVSDIVMPVMDGIQLVKELRKQGLDVPIVMLTGESSISVAIEALRSGAIDYVIKGDSLNTIKVVVDRALAKHQLMLKNVQLEQRVEQEVRKSREKDLLLLQQDRLASIGQLAAGVAHEINNPIGFIMSNLGTLKGYVENLAQFTSLLQTIIDKKCSGEEQCMVSEASQKLDITYILQDIIGLISESSEGAERVKRIVLDLKDFARVDVNSFKTVDLNECVESTLNMVRNEIRYVADVAQQLGKIPPLTCNPQQINQVITNLLMNAAHSIEGRGKITVSTSCVLDQVILSVADTGRGIPAEIRNRIFDPFFTTKEVGKGTGLGLSICYDIVKKHGGEITLTSEPGAGATFMVSLPISGPKEITV